MSVTTAAVIEAMSEAQRQVQAGEAWAVAVGRTEVWESPDYWQDLLQRGMFEVFVAAACLMEGERAVVFVTPVIVRPEAQRLDFRDPRGGPKAGESEELFGLVIDLDTGFDVLRCKIERDDEGSPHFGDIEVFEGHVQLTPETPGFTLLQSLLAY